jgi:hypothetical protein
MASVACPVYVHNQMLQTFTNDTRHFEKTDVTGRDLLKQWKQFYDENDLKKYQTWPKKNTELARPYTLLKDKDIERNRPIVPYCNHPLKRSLNMASRALTFMLEHSDINSYNLPKVQDLKRVVREVNKALRQNPDLTVHPRGGDLKNMFSELPHDTVFEALDWLFTRFAEKNHTDCVSMQRTGTQGVIMGRSRMAGWVVMDVKLVRLLLKFDIENCYYRVGNTVVKQVYGVPMGSPPSPPVASTVMQFYEHTFCTEDLPQLLSVECDSADQAKGCRFADDKLDLFLTTDDTGETADTLWESTANIYHPSMVMEDTPLDKLRFKFIGYDVHIAADRRAVTLSLHNPNETTIKKRQPQKKTRFPRAEAPSSLESKKSTAIGALVSVSRASTCERLFAEKGTEILTELAQLKYTKNLLKLAIYRAMHKERRTDMQTVLLAFLMKQKWQ